MIYFPTRGLRLGRAESQWHDVLRLFLILQVVFGHIAAIALPSVPDLTADIAANWPYITYRFMWRFGSQSAFLFVFLSGFMVAGPLLAHLSNQSVPSAGEFFSKRLKRIAPIAICAVLLTAVLDWLSAMAPDGQDLYRHGYAYDMVATATWTNFFGNLVFLQPVFVPAFGSNGPLWTLGYIVQYYAIGWVLCRLYTSHRRVAWASLSMVLIAMTLVRPEWSVLFVTWIAGGFARHVKTPSRFRVAFFLLGIAVFVWSNLLDPLIAAGLSIATGFLLTQALMHGPELRWISSSAWLRGLSNNSYVIYAVHHAVLVSAYVVAFRGAVGADPRFFLYVGVSVVAVLVASLLVNMLVNWLAASRPAPALERKEAT